LPHVVTPEEIDAVELFAALDLAQRERLSRVAADVSLVTGEYAAHEGPQRALFAVLEGRIGSEGQPPPPLHRDDPPASDDSAAEEQRGAPAPA
jgi:hypothetical protein